MESSHEFLEHTSELVFRIRGPSFSALLAEAGRALAALLLDEAREVTPVAAPRQLVVTASDREALLVHWLNELVYLAEADRWVPTAITAMDLAADGLRAEATGVAVAPAPTRVKAATFHGLAVRDGPDGVEAEVVLDV